MTKPMKHRELTKLLKAAGFTLRQGKGDHEKWYAPDGTHVTITDTTTVSAGLTDKALKAIERSKEGK